MSEYKSNPERETAFNVNISYLERGGGKHFHFVDGLHKEVTTRQDQAIKTYGTFTDIYKSQWGLQEGLLK